jgi:hypothetical protein
VKSIRRGEIQEVPDDIDIPIDVEEPKAVLGRLAVDLTAEDSRTTEEVPIPAKPSPGPGDSGASPKESDIYAELFGDDEPDD